MGEAYVEAKQARNGKLAAPKLSQASILGEPSEQREQPQGLVDASRNKDESSTLLDEPVENR